MSDEADVCPHCAVDLAYVGESGQRFSHRIGVEIRGVYDGVLFWACPECWTPWHRWDDHMVTQADLYMARWVLDHQARDEDDGADRDLMQVQSWDAHERNTP